MKKKVNNRKVPLMRSLIVPLMAVTVLHAVIFYSALAVNDTINGFNENSENMIAESSSNRASYLETEMNRKWNGLKSVSDAAESCIEKISAENNLSADEFLSSDTYTSEFLMNISDDMLATLRFNSSSGIFIILANSSEKPDSSEKGSYQGAFFSDSDSSYTPEDYSDLVLVKGSSSISKEYSIPYDINWTDEYDYIPNETPMDFFFKPMEAAHINPYADTNTLGYWSRPFYISDNNNYGSNLIIAYSEPVVLNNTVYGTVGITVSVDSITNLLSSAEVTSNDTGCYALLTYNEGSNTVSVDSVSQTTNGFEQHAEKKLLFSPEKNSRLKKIENVEINNSQAYGAVTELSLYSEKSPYSSEKWAVAAIAGRDSIYADSYSVRKRLFAALIISASIGAAAVYFVARYTLKPLKLLADSVKKYGGSNCIELIDTNISEINDLSVMLNQLSTKRTEYQNQLITERERYLVALQSINDNILEYDCENDTLYMYYFATQSDTNKVTAKEYPDFRNMVIRGELCHEDSIPVMLDFISGTTGEDGVYFRMISYKPDTDYIWAYAKSKNIYDSNGKLIRIIASTKDVTKQKEEEQLKLEKERRDPVTQLYKSDYGSIIASRFMIEMNNKAAINAIIRIVDMDIMLNSYGKTFCNAVLEEAALVIKRVVPEDYIIYRGGMDEFILITKLDSRTEARKLFRRIMDGISGIYSSGSIEIECVIGAYIKYADEPLDAARLKTRFASEAAYRFKDEFGGIVFADEVSGRVDFLKEFKRNGPHVFMPFEEPGKAEESDIISFAFNIFEKSDDVATALQVLISKAGRTLDLDRIVIFDMNGDYNAIRITSQWNAPEMAPIEVKKFSIGKNSFAKLEEKYKHKDYEIIDSVIFERDAIQDGGKNHSDGISYAVPMLDKDRIKGLIVFQCKSQDSDEHFINCIKELTKIISAYISKSITSQASRAKSEFLSKMSHEIRTPMNAIIGMTEIAMSSEDVSPSTMECLKKIDSSSHYLLSLINDILDMSRIESGKMTTEETYLNISELISGIDTMMRVQADNKGIWLKVEQDTPHIHLLGDPLKLNQILVNIIGNAVKFTNNGGVHLKVSETVIDDNTVNVFFSVKDTGIGISEEHLGRIFNSFEQADSGTVRKYGGTGLGLAISSNLVKLLGGKLEVHSIFGEGSEFFFTVPMKITEPVQVEEIADSDAVDVTSKRVLIVEDDELNIEIARTLIEAEGISTDVAENGKIAVDKFEASETGYYDAILMDIRMPVLGGIDATKQIRGMDRADAASIPIIAMTANAFDEDMKKSVECGMNGHLTKPIDMKKVMEMFRKIWSAK